MTKEVFIKLDILGKRLILQSEWTLENLSNIEHALTKISLSTLKKITLDGAAVTKLDSAGAWLISQYQAKLLAEKLDVKLQHFTEQHQKLLSLTDEHPVSKKDIPHVKRLSPIANLGHFAVEQLKETYKFLGFTGQLTLEALRISRHPSHIRWRAVISAVDKTGVQALPIIALLSFMIGVVISYQMGDQLRHYGANVFIVNLLGLSILREFGPLLTAIMVAGRTGSAFAAQLGIMKVNQEIDALNTMSVTPGELLLLPRIAGLIIILPLLTMWSDMFGIVGGMVMANNMLDISWYDFLQRFQREIPLRSLIIGLGKAPVFALLISGIGCFQGMQVAGSAESLGYRTTRSVVLAIFFIIVVDAGFSILFSKFKL